MCICVHFVYALCFCFCFWVPFYSLSAPLTRTPSESTESALFFVFLVFGVYPCSADSAVYSICLVACSYRAPREDLYRPYCLRYSCGAVFSTSGLAYPPAVVFLFRFRFRFLLSTNVVSTIVLFVEEVLLPPLPAVRSFLCSPFHVRHVLLWPLPLRSSSVLVLAILLLLTEPPRLLSSSHLGTLAFALSFAHGQVFLFFPSRFEYYVERIIVCLFIVFRVPSAEVVFLRVRAIVHVDFILLCEH